MGGAYTYAYVVHYSEHMVTRISPQAVLAMARYPTRKQMEALMATLADFTSVLTDLSTAIQALQAAPAGGLTAADEQAVLTQLQALTKQLQALVPKK